MSRRRVPNALARAFDEAQFGASRTLNLRAGLPSGADAAARADAWIRLKQVEGAKEVLIITGRGTHSHASVPVVRAHVAKRLASLQRAGIVDAIREHTAGSYVVHLTPLGTLPAAAPMRPSRSAPPIALSGLSSGTQRTVRELALRTFEALGVRTSSRAMLSDEMRRQINNLVQGMPPDADRDQWIGRAAAAALESLD